MLQNRSKSGSYLQIDLRALPVQAGLLQVIRGQRGHVGEVGGPSLGRHVPEEVGTQWRGGGIHSSTVVCFTVRTGGTGSRGVFLRGAIHLHAS